MKLKQFPMVVKALEGIMYDQPLPGEHLLLETEIPYNWEHRVCLAESLMCRIGDRTLESVLTPKRLAKIKEDSYHIDNSPGSALQAIIMPCDDNDKWVMEDFGATPEEISAVQELLGEFFDGELREVFSSHS